jgi:hypothetical protein
MPGRRGAGFRGKCAAKHPRDQKVCIDLSFFEDLKNRFRAPGDFAQAYVIAHEIGHHVQNLLGIADKIDILRRRVGETQGNH